MPTRLEMKQHYQDILLQVRVFPAEQRDRVIGLINEVQEYLEHQTARTIELAWIDVEDHAKKKRRVAKVKDAFDMAMVPNVPLGRQVSQDLAPDTQGNQLATERLSTS